MSVCLFVCQSACLKFIYLLILLPCWVAEDVDYCALEMRALHIPQILYILDFGKVAQLYLFTMVLSIDYFYLKNGKSWPTQYQNHSVMI